MNAAAPPDAELDQAILTDRCLELARNTPAAVLTYPALLAFCSLASPIGMDHPRMMGVLLLASVLTGVGRLAITRDMSEAGTAWLQRYRVAALAGGMVWGAFAAAAVHLYGSQWASQLAQVVTVGVTAGATSSLVSDYALLRVYVVAMIAPSALFLLSLSGAQAWSAPVLLLYILFILVTARNSSRRYLEGLRNQYFLRVRSRQLEEASRAKSDFLATMSHEIRTPMHAVFGLTEMLLATDLDTDQLEWVQILQQSCQSLLDIISGILDLSKIEAGKLELEEAPFDLRDCVDALVALFRPVVEKAGLTFRLDLEALPPGTRVIGDCTRVRQVLANFISNALKFTSSGSIVLAAVWHEGEVELTVRDTGIGIPADKVGILFRPFTQVDASTTRHYGGTGMGLAVCRSLSELMGGRVWLVSDGAVGGHPPLDWTPPSVVGTGSMFYFRFPVRMAPAPVPAVICEPEASVTGVRVLLAEDNVANQELFQALLERMGYQVWVAGTGLEVIELCKTHPFDVIFMDLRMPELDGIGSTTRVREMELAPRPWIVALTANAFQEDRERCLACGMDDYLAKPIRRADFVAALGRFGASRQLVPA